MIFSQKVEEHAANLGTCSNYATLLSKF